MKIGEQLKSNRDKAMFTQEELGKRAGVSGYTISRIESNQVEPRVSTIRKIAGALGIEPAELTAHPKAPAPLPFEDAGERGDAQGPLSRWVETAPLNTINQRVAEVGSEEIRAVVNRLARDLKWTPTLEGLRGEPRTESTARALNLARINVLAVELRRRGEEAPEESILAFRQWVNAMESPPEAEPRSSAGRGVSEAG